MFLVVVVNIGRIFVDKVNRNISFYILTSSTQALLFKKFLQNSSKLNKRKIRTIHSLFLPQNIK